MRGRRCPTRCFSALALVVAALCASAAALGAGAKPLTLGLGQGVAVSGTDIVCAFGGPANQVGLACLHTSPKGNAAYSFRIDEDELAAFRSASGRTTHVGGWKEPASRIPQPRSKAVSDFRLVAHVSVGARLRAAGTDLGCTVYAFKGRTVVACFKLDPGGLPLNGSYAAALDALGLQVSRFVGGHGTTVFVGP